MSIETSIAASREPAGQPYPYTRVKRPGTGLDPLPGLEGRHRRGTGLRCSGSALTASRTSSSCAS